jgi:DNA-binding response OmpR family regulator
MRVLVVEDEAALANALRIGLAKQGYAVDTAGSVAEAADKLDLVAYDVMVLDVSLPDGTGYELSQRVRAGRVGGESRPDLRILMLTARGGLSDRVQGLDVGADDYLVKPFAMPELSARIRALLRREVTAATSVMEVGPLRLDTARHLAYRDDRELSLTLKEFGVLRYLMSRPGHVVSSEELLEHVWDENADPFTQTVRVTVGTLRRKLSTADEPQLLETLVGRGYRLRADMVTA